MPAQIRTRATKALKENIGTENRRPKVIKKNKNIRKALGDKTNSLSDDNEPLEVPVEITKKANIIDNKNVAKVDSEVQKLRPRRQRRLPTRYIENEVINNFSNNQDNENNIQIINKIQKPKKTSEVTVKVSKKTKDINVNSKVSNTQSIKTSEQKKPITKNSNYKGLNLNKSSEVHKPSISEVFSIKHCNIIFERISEAPKSVSPLASKQVKETCLDTPSLIKTPSKNVDSSLIVSRPRRICRLPSRFEDHSISPSKFISVQPCHASTPIVSKSKTISDTGKNNATTKTNIYKNPKSNIKIAKKIPEPCTKIQSEQNVACPIKSTGKVMQKKLDEFVNKDVSPDSNNNPKQTKTLRNRNLITRKTSPVGKPTYRNGKRLLNKSDSFRILEDKTSKKNIDVYEFTFDPNEEPTPKKKKRKRVVKKKPVQTKKQVTYKNNYENNLSKTLDILKTVVSKKTVETQAVQDVNKQNANVKKTVEIGPNLEKNVNKPDILQNSEPSKPTSSAINNAVIAHSPVYDNVDFDYSATDVNYSPIHTESHRTPNANKQTHDQVNKDPLNLQEDLSFFDDLPVACSSVNVSKHPSASPWRVEFESLPIKWHVNSYVKPNMTPAVESSFISTEENTKKKHVYTNIVPLNNELLPQIVNEKNEPNLVQTSIVSFIKEVAEKQARRKLHKSPRKNHSLFEDITNTNNNYVIDTKKVCNNVFESNTSKKNTSNNSVSSDNENSSEIRKRKSYEDNYAVPAKSPKQKNKDCTYFGFDDSEQDENVSPIKNTKNRNIKSLRPRSRAVLNEINGNGPTRPMLPVPGKSNFILGSEAVNRVFEDLKSAADTPLIVEQNVNNVRNTNVDQSQVVDCNDESQSVHLFEDIDIVHHSKPTRKSYGKVKKVAFRQRSSDSDSQSNNGPELQESSDEDDLADLSFHIPEMQQKKTKKKPIKKKLMSKKEEKEAEAWAAGFNSMCEDIEEFTLVVE